MNFVSNFPFHVNSIGALDAKTRHNHRQSNVSFLVHRTKMKLFVFFSLSLVVLLVTWAAPDVGHRQNYQRNQPIRRIPINNRQVMASKQMKHGNYNQHRHVSNELYSYRTYYDDFFPLQSSKSRNVGNFHVNQLKDTKVEYANNHKTADSSIKRIEKFTTEVQGVDYEYVDNWPDYGVADVSYVLDSSMNSYDYDQEDDYLNYDSGNLQIKRQSIEQSTSRWPLAVLIPVFYAYFRFFSYVLATYLADTVTSIHTTVVTTTLVSPVSLPTALFYLGAAQITTKVSTVPSYSTLTSTKSETVTSIATINPVMLIFKTHFETIPYTLTTISTLTMNGNQVSSISYLAGDEHVKPTKEIAAFEVIFFKANNVSIFLNSLYTSQIF